MTELEEIYNSLPHHCQERILNYARIAKEEYEWHKAKIVQPPLSPSNEAKAAEDLSRFFGI